MQRTLYLVLLFASISLSAYAGTSQKLSREDALVITENTAKARGLDLKKFELSTSGHELSEDGQEWMFWYECIPAPSTPGCHFMVVVNRVNGTAHFIPGE